MTSTASTPLPTALVPPVASGASGAGDSAPKMHVVPPGRTTMSERERVAALREMMGAPDASVKALPDAIRTITFATHDRWVKPLYEQHWPEALQGSVAKKLRFLTCNLYATSPYTVLFSSSSPPLLVKLLRTLGPGLGLEPAQLSSWAGVGVKVLAKLIPDETHRRIIQIATFIAAVDHVFDHYMKGLSAEERGRRIRGMLDGSWSPDASTEHAGAFRFLRALWLEMGKGIEGEDKRVFDIAVARLHDYVDSEVKAMSGVPDPSGCCWRMAGVLGTIDGLFFPVWRYAGAPSSIENAPATSAAQDAVTHAGNPARAWMYSVSLFVQVMDDWIDLDSDALDIRPTPVLTGCWTLETVKETWDATVNGIVELAKQSGVDDEAWLTFVKETYRMMALEVMEAMCKGSAA
jgi:hypothetical protein